LKVRHESNDTENVVLERSLDFSQKLNLFFSSFTIVFNENQYFNQQHDTPS